jgi:hypothetical protein
MSDLTRRTASGRSQSARPLPYIVGGAGISAHIDIDHPVMGGPADRLRAWARAPNEADTRAPGASSALTVRARDAHRALPGLRHTVRPQDRHPAKSLTQGIAHASNKHLSPVVLSGARSVSEMKTGRLVSDRISVNDWPNGSWKLHRPQSGRFAGSRRGRTCACGGSGPPGAGRPRRLRSHAAPPVRGRCG